jgi:hypothetical protein
MMDVKITWKRWIVIAVCLGLVVARIIVPSIPVDAYTVWLVAIAAVLFILPDLRSFAPYVKRVKIGDYAEFELQETIEKLGSEIEKAQDAVADRSGTNILNDISSEVDQVLQESSRNPRAALLLLSARIEEQLRKRLTEAGLPIRYPLPRSIEIGIQAGIFPPELLPAFQDFWTVRNRVAHGVAFDVDDAYILSLVSLGTQLLRIASTGRPIDKQEVQSSTSQQVNVEH